MRAKFTYKLMKNEETGYCVFRYKLETGKSATLIGKNLPETKITYDFTVEEIENPKYGKQYKVLSFVESIENNQEEIIEYITITYKGIGKKTAEKIFMTFGEKSLDIVESEPRRLLQVKGITEKKVEAIENLAKEKKINKELYLFLSSYGFTEKPIRTICKIYPYDTLTQIKLDPYILCEVKGVNFFKADSLREACNIKPGDKSRVLAAAIHIMKTYMLEGNVGIDKFVLLKKLYEILKLESSYESCKDVLNRYLMEYIKSEKLSYRKVLYSGQIVQYMYLNHMAKTEWELARCIVDRLAVFCDPIDNISELIDKYSKWNSISLDESQITALEETFMHKLIIITGGPGSGKTTIIKEISSIHREIFDTPQEFLAPTGRAARRLEESTGEHSSTIHHRFSLRIHEQDEVFYDEDVEPITDGIVFVDEFSMVDMPLAYKLFSNIKGNTRLVLVGDEKQLQSVGPGNVLGDMIASGVVPVVTLRHGHRQGEGSEISYNAELIQKNVVNLKSSNEFMCDYIEDDDSLRFLNEIDVLQNLEDKMVNDYLSLLKNNAINTIACLCPYKKYPCGVYSVNKRIQNEINPLMGRIEMQGIDGMTFRENDLVMHLKNNEDTVNGDLGTVTYIGRKDVSDDATVMIVKYDTIEGFVDYEYTKDNIGEVTLAYATTIHKAQGCEYDAVIMSFTDFHKKMLSRNVLYTAITRAKKKVHLHCSRSALAKAIKNKHQKPRNTLLAYNICYLYEGYYKQMKLDL